MPPTFCHSTITSTRATRAISDSRPRTMRDSITAPRMKGARAVTGIGVRATGSGTVSSGVADTELIGTILSTRPGRPAAVATARPVPKPAARARLADAGMGGHGARGAPIDLGHGPAQVRDAFRAAEEPHAAVGGRPGSPAGARPRRRSARAGGTTRRPRSHRRPTGPCASQSRLPGWPATSPPRTINTRVPATTCGRTTSHSASESNCGASSPGASMHRSRHAGLLQRPRRCRGRWPSSAAPSRHEGGAPPAHRRNARRLQNSRTSTHRARSTRAACAASAVGSRSGAIAISGNATASSPAPLRASTQRTPSVRRSGDDAHGGSSARRSWSIGAPAARSGAAASSPSWPRPARRRPTAPAPRHAPARRRLDIPRPPRCAGVPSACQRACAASGMQQLPPIARRHSPLGVDGQPVRPAGAPAAPAARRRSAAIGRAPRCPARPAPRHGSISSGSNTARMRLAEPQALQAGGGQHDGVVLALVELAQAGVEVAAQRLDAQVGAQCAQLHHAAQAGGADDGALRQLGRARRRWARRRRRAGPRAPARRPGSKPSGRSIGTSFSECTAMWARPSSSAVSSSFTNRPLPPTLLSVRSRIWSPRVVMPSRPTVVARRCWQQVAHVFGLPQRQAALAGGDQEVAQGSACRTS